MNWKRKGQFNWWTGLFIWGLGPLLQLMQFQLEDRFRSGRVLREPMYETQRRLGRRISARLRRES